MICRQSPSDLPPIPLRPQVPRFLDTCTGDARKVVINHGVEVVASEAAMVARVVQLCRQWVQRVPVLVITSGPDELLKAQSTVKLSSSSELSTKVKVRIVDNNNDSNTANAC